MSVRYLSDNEIAEGMEYWRSHYDEKMAKIFYRTAMRDRHTYKWVHEKLIPNLSKCIECEYSTVVYNDELVPLKIECEQGATLLDMVKDYCILIK